MAQTTLFDQPSLPFGEPLELTPPATPRVHVPSALYAAATSLAEHLANNQRLTTNSLRDAMTDAFGALDADGAWVWKDAYDAAEAATLLYLFNRSTPIPHTPHERLAWYQDLEQRELTHSKRSETQIKLQQYSTPLPYAALAAHALGLTTDDRLLEPSAGTGVLAAVARAYLHPDLAGRLYLNEIGSTRAALLGQLFPEIQVTSYNAEDIHQYLPQAKPTAVLMNPPFSASPARTKIYHRADLRHVRSAFATLPPGGRLVTITAETCWPASTEWQALFHNSEPKARVLFTAALDGNVYKKRGTTFDNRLTVIEKDDEPTAPIKRSYKFNSLNDLLTALLDTLPPRLPVSDSRPQPITSASDPRIRERINPIIVRNDTPPANTPEPQAEPELAPVQTTRPPLSLVSDKPGASRAGKPGTIPTAIRSWHNPEPLAYHTVNAEDLPLPRETNGPYAVWQPSALVIDGAQPHPSPLVQSLAMSAVPHPKPSYQPLLPPAVKNQARLSDAQLESVILAGESHKKRLATRYRILSDHVRTFACNVDDDREIPVTEDGLTWSSPTRFRQGWMLGDGTGTGKGREVAGVILDNWLRGRKKALWLSQSDKLVEDARRDWVALGGIAADVFALSRFKQGQFVPFEEGILFTTYATLRSPSRENRPSRLDQIITWLAGSLDESDRHEFGGVVVFDESHALANAATVKNDRERGNRAPSQQGRTGLMLQNALPDARILYVSATGASTLQGLSYAGRLGLWGGDDTPFEDRDQFVSTMEEGGVAAMEVVARDLKALGLYQCRALDYDGIEIDLLLHELTPAQRKIYDSYAEAFYVIHKNIDAALEATGAVGMNPKTGNMATLNKRAKKRAYSLFESAKQRFFNHLLNGMKCPSLIRSIENDLANDRSAVIQLISTDEALMERRLAEIPSSEWDDLNIDLTPRDTILSFLEHAFPTQLQETRTDDEGNPYAVPVYDNQGNIVFSQEAIARREAMIEKLALLPAVPSALDQIVHYFGHDSVAEITGRSRRILKLTDNLGDTRLALRTRPGSANLKEADAFMDGEKRILVFSLAGGTGRSYHADLSCNNTQRRVHYLLEAGWRADMAIQGLGRTHRTHQASVPLFRPVTTNVKGERRFIATIAKRLNALGAITRGQRDSQMRFGNQEQRLFRESDNFESLYAKVALRQLYAAIHKGIIDGWSLLDFQDATGLTIIDQDGDLLEKTPPMSQFLNRILALPLDSQNELFGQLEERLDANIDQAVVAGTYEMGIETVRADAMQLLDADPLYEHPGAGAITQLLRFNRRRKAPIMDASQALHLARFYPHKDGKPWCLINKQSGRPAFVVPAPSLPEEDGSILPQLRLIRPTSRETVPATYLAESNWQRITEPTWEVHWTQECESTPEYLTDQLWLATGLLLPVWNRFPNETMRVRRIITDDGKVFIGRLLHPDHIRAVRQAFGIDGNGDVFNGSEVFQAVFERGRPFKLINDWRITRRTVEGKPRIELEGPVGTETNGPKRLGCQVEVIGYQARVFIPRAEIVDRLLRRWPLAA